MQTRGQRADNLGMAKATLSALLSNASGSIGQDVIYLTRQGLAVRPKPRYRQFPNPATAGARSRMLAAKAVWESLTLEQVQAWREYAASITIHRPLDGAAYSPIAYNAFIGLATRVLQADPSAFVPLLPPVSEFIGEGIVVNRVQGIGSGVVRFWASGPNSDGVVTELMAQKLANIRRMPKSFYKSLSFVAFVPNASEDPEEPCFVDLTLDRGAYAFAYRFVKKATGQTRAQMLLGVLEVL